MIVIASKSKVSHSMKSINKHVAKKSFQIYKEVLNSDILYKNYYENRKINSMCAQLTQINKHNLSMYNNIIIMTVTMTSLFQHSTNTYYRIL